MPAATKSRADNASRVRARRSAQGLTSIEAVLHRDEIASLDQIKHRLGVASRSEVLRLMIAKLDPETLTAADAAKLDQGAA